MISPDIRAGMAMLLAAVCAEGTSTINNADQIERGYERIDERLNALGAKIERRAGKEELKALRLSLACGGGNRRAERDASIVRARRVRRVLASPTVTIYPRMQRPHPDLSPVTGEEKRHEPCF